MDKLVMSAMVAITNKFKNEKFYNVFGFKSWEAQYATFAFGNTRTCTVSFHRRKDNHSMNHYCIEYLMKKDSNRHYTLEEVAQKLIELGNENKSFVNGKLTGNKLEELGFRTDSNVTLDEVASMMNLPFSPYRLKLSDDVYYGREYTNSPLPYYGSTYCDVKRKEYIEVLVNNEYKQVAYRYVTVGTKCVSNYVGD